MHRLVLLSLLMMFSACAPLDVFTPPKLGETAAPKLTSKEESLLRLADSTRAAGDIPAAEKLYAQAVAQSKGAVKAHLALAEIYRLQKRYQPSLDILQAAAQLQPQNTEVLKELGHTQQAMNRLEEAVKTYDKAIAINAKDGRLYNGKGVALDALGQHKEAQAAYRKGIKAAPEDNTYIENNLALSLILSTHYDEAILILQRLMNTEAANPTVRQNLALAYGLSGDEETAMKLGLQDLPPKEAKENIEFFRQYIQSRTISGDTRQAVPVGKVESKAMPVPAKKKKK